MALVIVALWSLRLSSINKGSGWQTAAKYFLVVSHGQSLLYSDQNILFPILTENLSIYWGEAIGVIYRLEIGLFTPW